jgi:putative glutamine amidotransferase
MLGAATVETNSSHHQAPDELPALLARAGVSSDGVIEAAEGPGFTVGVGWHPETDSAGHATRLLAAFTHAASEKP